MKGSDRHAIFKVIRMMPNREAAATVVQTTHRDALKRLVSTHFVLPKLTLLQVGFWT